MAYTETTNYDLRKCAKGDSDWHTPMNWNLDQLDDLIWDASGQAASAEGKADAAQGTADKKGYKKYANISASVAVTVDDTYVGTGYAVAIPADSILKGFLIKIGAPGGTAGGAKTVQVSIGTVANADAELTDDTDIDVMVASGEKTAAAIHGDEASDHVAAYFPMDMFGRYFAAATDLFLNIIGKAASATGTPGTVTSTITVYALIEQLV